MRLDAKTAALWRAYLASLPHAEDAIRRFYEVFRIGNSPEGADEGAALIKQGLKTATSSLLWAYEAIHKPLPEVGALSIVTDSRGNPVCVIETLAVNVSVRRCRRRLCVRLWRMGPHPGDVESPLLGAQCATLPRLGESADANIAVADATVIRRLTSAGMILLGKTHTVQFAFGIPGINHDQGTPHNPWHSTPYLPGGSSSGSAVAVAAGLAPIALGTDTGGSIRVPASLCGTVGLTPTVGRVSGVGVFPLSLTLDSIGFLARSVGDLALAYQCGQGFDPQDPITLGAPPQDVLTGLGGGVRGLRLAFPETGFLEDADAEVARAMRECAEVFASLGAQVNSIALPEMEEVRTLVGIVAAEAYSLHRMRFEQHAAEYEAAVAAHLLRGKQIGAAEYLDMTRAVARLRAGLYRSLRDVDGLLLPTTPLPAVPVKEVADSLEAYVGRERQYMRTTYSGNLLDLCGLSVPCGFTALGLPIGLLINGKPFDEAMVLRIGFAFERATNWHDRTPDLSWASTDQGGALS